VAHANKKLRSEGSWFQGSPGRRARKTPSQLNKVGCGVAHLPSQVQQETYIKRIVVETGLDKKWPERKRAGVWLEW
jgi:hypothetical protein